MIVTKSYYRLYEPLSLLNYKLALDGIEKAKDKSIVVAGCIRDVKPEIFQQNLDKCNRIISKFSKYHMIIVENDSTNMNFIQNNNKNVTFISKTFGWPKLGDGRDVRRTTLMSMIRNQYVNLIREKYSSYDYVLIIDFDIDGFRMDGVFNSIGQNNWDVIGANGIQTHEREVYYDTFALIEQDFKTYDTGVEKQTFKVNDSLYPVFACFGGVALYKMNAFLAGRKYASCSLDGKNISEQCSIFKGMHQKGFNKIFINPNLVVIR